MLDSWNTQLYLISIQYQVLLYIIFKQLCCFHLTIFVNVLFQKMSDKCFKKCVSSPGSSLGNSETVRTFQRNSLNDKWVNAGHIQVFLSENSVDDTMAR